MRSDNIKSIMPRDVTALLVKLFAQPLTQREAMAEREFAKLRIANDTDRGDERA